MLLTICVSRMLCDVVAAPHGVLVTRPTGAAVRHRIQAELAQSRAEVALLDFSRVTLLDFSCADEVVAKLLQATAEPARYVVLGGLEEEQREAIDHVLARQGLAVSAVRAADRGLLGWSTDELRTAFAEVCCLGPLEAPHLAERLGWPLARAARALAELARHRVVRERGARYHPLPSSPIVT